MKAELRGEISDTGDAGGHAQVRSAWHRPQSMSSFSSKSLLVSGLFLAGSFAPGFAQTLDHAAYLAAAHANDRDGINSRLGPTFEQLNPGAADDRPTLFKQTSKVRASGSYSNKTNPYELGTNPSKDGDYWSDTGQVAYVAEDPVNNPGLDRIQTFAYYDKVYALSPRLDFASGKASPDPQTRESTYINMLGGRGPKQPIAMVRSYGMQQNESLVLYKDGLLALAASQTSRKSTDRPFPGILFPAHKVPTALAVTTSNEFALVTVWDTETQRGQLAVVALEGKFIPYHTWPYIGFPNQGSWSDFKLLGYIDLPMSMPSAVSAGSNGFWNGPSQTDGKSLSQINLSLEWVRDFLYDGSWRMTVADKGYAIVASKRENMAVVVNLAPLFKYMRDSYLGSAASFAQTLATRGKADNQFPQTFSVNPAIKPTVVYQMTVAQPTAVLAGFRIDRWSKDRYKGYVASEDGTIHVLDTSSLLARFTWEKSAPILKLGSFRVGKNPTAMAFARHQQSNLPLIPRDAKGEQYNPDPLNNLFWVTCRGDREVVQVVTWGGEGAVHHRIRDSRMGDPVGVSVATRGNIVSVTDFSGKKLLSYRIGAIKDLRNKVTYGCGPTGTDPFEFAGELLLPGWPFLVTSTNLN